MTSDEDVVARLRVVVEKEPNNADAMVGLARVLDQRGGMAETRSLYETALALQPADEALAFEFACALIRMGDLIAADFRLSGSTAEESRALRRGLGRWKRAQGRLLIQGARVCRRQGRHEEALASYRLALGYGPDRLRWRIEAAEFLVKAGRYALAEAYLEDAPNDARVRDLRSHAGQLRSLGPHGLAALAAQGLDWAAAAGDLMHGRPILAAPILRGITLVDPDNTQAWPNLRAALLMLGRTREAEAIGAQWSAASSPSKRWRIEKALDRRASARGLPFDLQDRFPLVAKEKALSRVDRPQDLKTASDAYLVVDPGGARVQADPFLMMPGQEAPPRIDFTTGEAFVLALDDAIVAGQGAVITRNGALIRDQFMAHRAHKYEAVVQDETVVFGPGFAHEPVPLQYAREPVFLCMGPMDLSFGDWIIDFLPRLALAKAAELDCKILVNRRIPDRFVEMLGVLGVERDRILFQKNWHAIAYPRVYVSSWPAGIRNQPMADWLGIFRDAAVPARRGERPLLYLTRKHIGHRPLVNEEEICDLFVSHGFREINPDRLSLPETLDLFSNPACIAGPWGSAFENVVFSSRPPVCLALMPRYSFKYMHNVGVFMHEARVAFGYVVGREMGPGGPNHAPWIVDLDDAKRALDQTLELVEATRRRDPQSA